MASEGPIDKLNIEVGVTPDLSGLDRAKAEAAQKGQEIGEAVAAGVQQGSASNVQGPGGRVDSGASEAGAKAESILDKKFAAAEKEMDAVEKLLDKRDEEQKATETLSLSATAAAVQLAGLAAAINLIKSTLTDMVRALADETKKGLETAQAASAESAEAGVSDALQIESENARIGGDPNTDVSRLQRERSRLRKQSDELRTKLGTRGTLNYFRTFDPIGAVADEMRSQESQQYDPMEDEGYDAVAMQKQIAENERRAFAISDQISAVASANARRYTVGGRASETTGEPMVGRGQTLSRAGAAYVDGVFAANPASANDSTNWLRKSYYQQQDSYIDSMRQGREVAR